MAANYQQAAVDIATQYAIQLLGRYGQGPQRTGRSAARGVAQYQAEIGKRQLQLDQQRFAQEQLQVRRENAFSEFGRTNPFEPGFEQETLGYTSSSPKRLELLGRNQEKLAQLSAKKQTKRVIAKERLISAKILKRSEKLGAYTDVRISELRGPNAGYWAERGAPPPLWLTQGDRA